MPNKCSKQDFILIIAFLVIVAAILKVVGNLFQTFSFRQLNMVQMVSDCACIT